MGMSDYKLLHLQLYVIWYAQLFWSLDGKDITLCFTEHPKNEAPRVHSLVVIVKSFHNFRVHDPAHRQYRLTGDACGGSTRGDQQRPGSSLAEDGTTARRRPDKKSVRSSSFVLFEETWPQLGHPVSCAVIFSASACLSPTRLDDKQNGWSTW